MRASIYHGVHKAHGMPLGIWKYNEPTNVYKRLREPTFLDCYLGLSLIFWVWIINLGDDILQDLPLRLRTPLQINLWPMESQNGIKSRRKQANFNG